MNKISGLAFRYMRQNKHRTVTTLVGVALSAMIIYVIFTCGYSAYDAVTYDSYQDRMGWDAVYRCDSDTAEELVKLAPFYGEHSVYDDGSISLSHAFFMCEDDACIKHINNFAAMPVQFSILYGTTPKGESGVIIPESTARMDKISVGDTYLYTWSTLIDEERVDYEKELLVTGIYSETFDGSVDDIYQPMQFDMYTYYMPMNQQVLDMHKDSDTVQVYVTFENKQDINSQAKAISEAAGIEEYYVNQTAVDCYATLNEGMSTNYLGLQAVLMFVAGIGAIAALFIVRNAFNISVHERNNDYGVLRCIGMSRKQIVRIILVEVCIVSLAGIVIGIGVGHVISTLGFMYARSLLELSAAYKISFYGKALLLTVVYSIITSAFAMIGPVEKLHKLNPIEAMRKSTEIKTKKEKPSRGKFLTRIFGFEVGYAYKNLMRRKGRFLISVVTLSVGVTLYVAISTAFSLTENWFDTTMFNFGGYDGYFYVSDYSEAVQIEKDLYKLNAVDKTLSYSNISCINLNEDEEDNGKRCSYLVVDKEIYNKLLDASEVVDSKSNLNDDKVLSVIKTDDSETYDVGDTFEVPIGENESMSVYIYASIPSDKYKEIVIDSGIYNEEEFPDNSANWQRFICCVDSKINSFVPWGEEYMCINDICLKVALSDDISTKTFDEYIKHSTGIYVDIAAIERKVASSLNAVKSIITVFILLLLAIFITNVINVNRAEMLLRKDEFRVMRCIGMSYKQESKVLYSESFITICISIIIGSIIGTLFGWGAFKIMFWDAININYAVDWISILISVAALVVFSVLTTFLSREDV